MSAVPLTLSPVTLTNGVATPISATPIYASSVIFEADALNTNNIYYGASNVSVSNGATLSAGKKLAITFDIALGVNGRIDLSKIYFDTDSTSNKVRVSYLRWDGG